MSAVPTMTPRRTQASRRAATRQALLDATLDTLVEVGHSGTTTTEVCRRAGVSQGALFKHFPTKAELLAAALEMLFPRLRGGFRDAFAAASDGAGDAPIDEALDLLRDVYRRPDTRAALELYAAARTDADLAATLAGVEAAHRRAIIELAAAVLPTAAERLGADFAPAVNLVLDALNGLAITTAFEGANPRDDEFQLLTTIAHGLLGPSH